MFVDYFTKIPGNQVITLKQVKKTDRSTNIFYKKVNNKIIKRANRINMSPSHISEVCLKQREVYRQHNERRLKNIKQT